MTPIVCIDKDSDVLIERINKELVKLTEGFKVNKLSLNVKKSNCMVFGNKIVNKADI